MILYITSLLHIFQIRMKSYGSFFFTTEDTYFFTKEILFVGKIRCRIAKQAYQVQLDMSIKALYRILENKK